MHAPNKYAEKGLAVTANGLWQMNTREEPYGASPGGHTWGNIPWDEAAALPGAAQQALGKRLLERYEWWRFEPHQDWVSPQGTPEHFDRPFAAGIPREVRIIYIYGTFFQSYGTVEKIEPGVAYTAFFWDPRTGAEYPIGPVQPDANGSWMIPREPELTDWVLVLERSS